MKTTLDKFHVLSKNKATAVPYRQLYFDTETTYHKNSDGDTEHKLKLGCAIYKVFNPDLTVRVRKVHYFNRSIDFFNLVMGYSKGKQKLVLYAHNIFFDLWITKFYLNAFKHGWKSQVPFSQGLTYIDKLTKKKRSIQLINVGNYFHTTVRKMGDLVGLPKLIVDFDNVTNISLFQYCRRDVEIIEKMMEGWIKFIREHDLGNIAPTLAGQAFNSYRHRFMKHKIYVHRYEQPEDMERQAYYGGRCECFYIGKIEHKRIYKLDINSMYPSVMRKNLYPVRFMYNIPYPDLRRLKIALQKAAVIANVDIVTEKPAYPFKKDNKLIFPVGRFTTTLCSPELNYALDHGHIAGVNRIALYNHAEIFTSFVDYFYNLRNKYKEEGNDIYQYIVKIILNSLYGKFAQKERMSQFINIDDHLKVSSNLIYDMETKEKNRVVTFGGTKRITSMTEKASRNSITAISAFVTSYARVKLQKIMDLLPAGSYYYCDTDSLFINTKALKILEPYIDDKKIGYWKVEDMTTRLEIRTLKDYTFKDNIKRKGITKSALKIGRDIYKMDIWPGFPMVFSQSLSEPYKVKSVIKHLKCNYTKGDVLKSGFVDPVRLNELPSQP